jgi:hypothetical protein
MPIAKRNLPDVIACLLIACFGIVAIIIGLDYKLGQLTRMGPGYFPMVVGSLIVVLSIFAAIESARSEGVAPDFKLRPIVFISLGMLAWTLLIEDAGLIPSTIALIGLSSMARAPFRPVSVGLLIVGLCVAGYFVFIAGLGMPLTVLGR